MTKLPKIVFFFPDTKIDPTGVLDGGGESASRALAQALKKAGREVIVCANLNCPEISVDGVEYWNYGDDYRIDLLAERLKKIETFHCLCSTFFHPILLLREHRNCQLKIVVNHSGSVFANGVVTQTVLNWIHLMVCVSEAQRKLVLDETKDDSKVIVIRNGFDPEIFKYEGPENRDYSHIVAVGRVETWKGSKVLFDFFPVMKKAVPNAKLTFLGDYSKFPGLSEKKHLVEAENPGLTFRGKVSQKEIAEYLRKVGLLVFPSLVFETAGLAVLDAQACGCPAVAFDVGGVKEYLIDKKCGFLISDQDYRGFYTKVIELMMNPLALQELSRNCQYLARSRTWDVVAGELLTVISRMEEEVNFQDSSAESTLRDHLQELIGGAHTRRFD